MTFDQFLKKQKVFTRMWDGVEDLSGMTLVIKHTWGIGDILFTTPVVHELKKKFPTCKIIYVTRWEDLLQGNPDIDQVFPPDALFYPDGVLTAILSSTTCRYISFDTELKGGIDFKVDLHGENLKQNEHVARILQRSNNVLNLQERQLVQGYKLSNGLGGRYHRTVLDAYCAHGFVPDAEKKIYYYPSPDELARARMFVPALKKEKDLPVIALVPRTSTVYKDYPHWREVLWMLDGLAHVMILGSFHDPKMQYTKYPYTTVYDCIGSFTLRESAALLKFVDLFVSSDTGLLYIRGSYGLPGLSLYGPHEPGPFISHFPSLQGLRIKVLKNGECSTGCWIDTVSCKKEKEFSPCMEELEPGVVFGKICEMLEIDEELYTERLGINCGSMAPNRAALGFETALGGRTE